MCNQVTILLVEDSYSQALRVQLLLQREGYQVRIASDGAEGWRQACEQSFDLILLDVNLPTLDGFQVLTRLKFGRSTRMIPVIMLARSNVRGTIERALQLGAIDYLCKDECLDADQETGSLQAAISKVLPQRRAMAA